MINFINGGASSNREKLFIDAIETSVKNGREVVVIIPDQFSYDYDKKLYDRLGAVRFNKLTTAGFNRLSELLENMYGGSGTGNANDNAKIILMYKAVKTLRSKGEICYYTKLADKRGLEKGNFISQLIELVQQMRESGISCETASAAAEMLDGSLAQKMTDISRIYSEYMSQLEKAGLHDSVSSISAAVKAARKNSFFEHKDVFIDAFSSFTYDELNMIELCFSQADNVTVSLVIDNDCVKNSIHPFRMPVMTFGILKSLAGNREYSIVETTEETQYSPEIVYVCKNLLNISKTVYCGSGDNVRVLNADDVYSEAAFVCAQIKQLVSENDYSYSDIAIILRNMQDSSSVFESMLERYDIPFFIDKADRISASSIVHYFSSLFNCVITKQYKTDNILKLVKSPFFSPKKHNANMIEQYCLKWNIDGDMWVKDYFGLDIESVKSESEREHIESVEKIRKLIIEPFERLKKACSGEIPASQMCQSFFALLDEMKISQRTYSVVRAASNSGNDTQIELSRGLRQLWEKILSAVKSIYDCLDDDKISLRQFFELFRVMVSQMSVSNPPQKIDCIRIADASHSRLSNIKAAFICQVNDGVFPKSYSNSSLLSGVDITQLCSALKGVDNSFDRLFGADAKYSLMQEELSCYNAVSSATDKLYLTYINSDLTGEEKLPSTLVSDVLKCFAENKPIESSKNEKISEIPLDFFCTSAKTAFHTVVEHFRDDDAHISAIKMSLGSTQYASKLAALSSGSDKLFESTKTNADKELCAGSFFNDSVAAISASQIDSFYECPFGYFCKYGLKLSPPEKMDMNAIHKGNLIHKALDIGFRYIEDSKGFFLFDDCASTDEKIKKLIESSFDEYYVEKLNSDFGKSAVFAYEFEQLKSVAYTIVKYVQKELLSSNYKPLESEYRFGDENKNRVIRFETKGGRILSVKGSIDRVDVSQSGDRQYIRIIDYKTGRIEINEAKLLCGLNLQMFVYLDAFFKCENEIGNKIPAGIEYMSFGDKVKSFRDSSILESKYDSIQKKNVLEAYKPKGLVSDSSDVLETFDNGENTDLIYAPFNDCGEGKIPAERFEAIREFANNKVTEFGNALENGRFPMNPVGKVCDYCDYRTVCGREKYGDTSGIIDNKDELKAKFNAQINDLILKRKDGEDQ